MAGTGHFATTGPDDPMRYRASGRPVLQFEAAVVDADDNEVPAGEAGELVVRPRRPGVMMTGYDALPRGPTHKVLKHQLRHPAGPNVTELS